MAKPQRRTVARSGGRVTKPGGVRIRTPGGSPRADKKGKSTAGGCCSRGRGACTAHSPSGSECGAQHLPRRYHRQIGRRQRPSTPRKADVDSADLRRGGTTRNRPVVDGSASQGEARDTDPSEAELAWQGAHASRRAVQRCTQRLRPRLHDRAHAARGEPEGRHGSGHPHAEELQRGRELGVRRLLERGDHDRDPQPRVLQHVGVGAPPQGPQAGRQHLGFPRQGEPEGRGRPHEGPTVRPRLPPDMGAGLRGDARSSDLPGLLASQPCASGAPRPQDSHT